VRAVATELARFGLATIRCTMLSSLSFVRGLTVAALLILGPLGGAHGPQGAYADSLPVLAAGDSPAG